MSDTQPPAARPSVAGEYELRLRGHLADRWADWFDGLTVTRDDDGTTRLRGAVVDQAALHGLLHKVRDTGLPLLSVTPVDPVPSPPTTHPARRST
jgi:hypothetical protein